MSTAPMGTARIGAARIGAARIGAARIGAARIGTAPVFIPVSLHRAMGGQSRPTTRSVGASRHQAGVKTVPADWQLTDRGIAAVIAIAAVLMAAAVVVIGLTAVRVTSGDYEPNMQGSQQVRH
jgi:hypothetical protein